MSLLPLICLLFPSFFFLGASTNDQKQNPSAYEVLQQYDFPIGILPQGSTGYDLNPYTGKFSSYLNQTCTFSLTNLYDLRYESIVSGIISKDQIRKLSGVSVRVLNKVWLKIRKVNRIGDHIEFSVGVTSAKFPVSSFEESPQCGCGFKCNAYSGGFINQFLSSSL
ncbi:hypothetical protein M9H77_01694 [Catharanthus roseus]|uniref:Uncharacterized protein n=1 Tax=Catharanthus roseus TaxID=4058 RepID=A0ACC0C6A4_CATRO|nr:hypothetical protein M9H77_01694 [Catharanthus roseus]